MKIVKASVIIMGVLIVLGMVLLVYGFITRLGKAPTDEPAASTAPLVPLTTPGAGFGEVEVTLDVGEIVLEAEAEGTRMMLRTKKPDGTETIRVYDLTSGQSLGRFNIRN